jgi:hypothetical protein
MNKEIEFQNNWELSKPQLIALVNVIEKITYNQDTDQDKISKIKYWFGLKKEML